MLHIWQELAGFPVDTLDTVEALEAAKTAGAATRAGRAPSLLSPISRPLPSPPLHRLLSSSALCSASADS